MKRIKSLKILLVIIISGFFLISCNTKSYTHYSYLVKVDSIHVPQNLTANTPFVIDCFGFVGPDGCYSFESFNQVITTTNDIMVEAWATYRSDSETCTSVLVYLNGHLNLTIPAAGIYNLKIKQPDNTYLERQLTVN